MSETGLVKEWIDAETIKLGRLKTSAIKDLNESTGSMYTHSRICELINGTNNRGIRLPKSVRRYMLSRCLENIFEKEDIELCFLNTRQRNRLLDRLT